MVAGDTKIALVALVALLGLFGVAQTVGLGLGALGVDPSGVAYEGEVDGQAQLWGQRGTSDPVTGECRAPACREPFVDVSLEVDGLPDGGGLHYVAYLYTPEDEIEPDLLRLGELEATGDTHRLDVNRTGVDGRAYETLQVRLGANADGPLGPVVLEREVGPLEGKRPPPVDLSGRSEFEVRGFGWSCCRTYPTILEINSPPSFEGLTRCAWLADDGPLWQEETDDGEVQATPGFQGSFTAQGCSTADAPSWTFTADRLDGVGAILVTYEVDDGSEPAEPGGFAAFHARVYERT